MIRRVLFSESSPILCQAREGEGGVGGLVNHAFFQYLGFLLMTVEDGACARVGFLPNGPFRL